MLPDAFLHALARANLITHVLDTSGAGRAEAEDKAPLNEDEVIDLLYACLPSPVLRLAAGRYAFRLGPAETLTEEEFMARLKDCMGEREASLERLDTPSGGETSDAEVTAAIEALSQQLIASTEQQIADLQKALSDAAAARTKRDRSNLVNRLKPFATLAKSMDERLAQLATQLEDGAPDTGALKQALPDALAQAFDAALTEQAPLSQRLGRIEEPLAAAAAAVPDLRALLKGILSAVEDGPLAARLAEVEARLDGGRGDAVEDRLAAIEAQIGGPNGLSSQLAKISQQLGALSVHEDLDKRLKMIEAKMDQFAAKAPEVAAAMIGDALADLPEQVAGMAKAPVLDGLATTEERLHGEIAEISRTVDALAQRPEAAGAEAIGAAVADHTAGAIAGFADQLETLSDSLGQQILAAAKDPDGLASEATLLDLGERVAFMAEQMQTMGDGRDMALERAGLARSSTALDAVLRRLDAQLTWLETRTEADPRQGTAPEQLSDIGQMLAEFAGRIERQLADHTGTGAAAAG